MDRSCSNCAFWQSHSGRDKGDCRHRSPRADKGLWPKTYKRHWCGDHATHKEAEARRNPLIYVEPEPKDPLARLRQPQVIQPLGRDAELGVVDCPGDPDV